MEATQHHYCANLIIYSFVKKEKKVLFAGVKCALIGWYSYQILTNHKSHISAQLQLEGQGLKQEAEQLCCFNSNSKK